MPHDPAILNRHSISAFKRYRFLRKPDCDMRRGLVSWLRMDLRWEPCLGGQLLYAGELDATGRALVVAGNIAGAASLAAATMWMHKSKRCGKAWWIFW